VSPVKYELGFYISEDAILRSHRRGDFKSYIAFTVWALYRRRNVSPVRYALGFHIPEDAILHSHRCGNLKSYIDAVSSKLRDTMPVASKLDVLLLHMTIRFQWRF
jgi:hypothetical protein